MEYMHRIVDDEINKRREAFNANEEALSNPEHPKALYREPSALIVICATAPMGYTTENGVKIVPIGCLKD